MKFGEYLKEEAATKRKDKYHVVPTQSRLGHTNHIVQSSDWQGTTHHFSSQNRDEAHRVAKKMNDEYHAKNEKHESIELDEAKFDPTKGAPKENHEQIKKNFKRIAEIEKTPYHEATPAMHVEHEKLMNHNEKLGYKPAFHRLARG